MTKKYLTSSDKVLAYCPGTGSFFLKLKKGWKQTGLCKNKDGYVTLTLNKTAANGQRVAMLAMGIDPSGFVVDHINRDRSDNRFANLRLLTVAENAINTASVSVTLTPYGTYRSMCGGISLGSHSDEIMARGACLWYRRSVLLEADKRFKKCQPFG